MPKPKILAKKSGKTNDISKDRQLQILHYLDRTITHPEERMWHGLPPMRQASPSPSHSLSPS